MGLYDDIFEQPAVLKRALETQFDTARQIGQAVQARGAHYVFLAARGTSDHAGVYAQYVWGSLNQLPVALAAPSLFTRYGEWPSLTHALVVGISQSGQSPDVVEVVAEGRRQGAPTLAITNDPESPLAQAAEFTLGIQAGLETAVAASKTYTSELMAVALLAAAMSRKPEQRLAELSGVPAAVEAVLEGEEAVQRLAEAHTAIRQCVVLGRGYNYATALEWALKLKELVYVLADPYAAPDFMHGPIALIHPDFPVLAIVPSGAVFDDLLPLLGRLRHDLGARLLVLSDRDEALSVGQEAVRLPAGVPEWLSPLVAIVPAQLFCYHLARACGYDTEAPRTIRKITETL